MHRINHDAQGDSDRSEKPTGRFAWFLNVLNVIDEWWTEHVAEYWWVHRDSYTFATSILVSVSLNLTLVANVYLYYSMPLNAVNCVLLSLSLINSAVFFKRTKPYIITQIQNMGPGRKRHVTTESGKSTLWMWDPSPGINQTLFWTFSPPQVVGEIFILSASISKDLWYQVNGFICIVSLPIFIYQLMTKFERLMIDKETVTREVITIESESQDALLGRYLTRVPVTTQTSGSSRVW